MLAMLDILPGSAGCLAKIAGHDAMKIFCQQAAVYSKQDEQGKRIYIINFVKSLAILSRERGVIAHDVVCS